MIRRTDAAVIAKSTFVPNCAGIGQMSRIVSNWLEQVRIKKVTLIIQVSRQVRVPLCVLVIDVTKQPLNHEN